MVDAKLFSRSLGVASESKDHVSIDRFGKVGHQQLVLSIGRPGSGLKPKGLKEKMVRKDRTRTMLVALLGLFSSAGLATPTRAETGTVSVVFTKAGFVVGVGGGRGVLNFHGKNYPFTVRGASLGATIGASTTKLVGKALHLKGYRDIEGTYSALGAGGAFAAGAGGVQLQNASGVILQLTGAKVGVELSASLAGVTIMMD